VSELETLINWTKLEAVRMRMNLPAEFAQCQLTAMDPWAKEAYIQSRLEEIMSTIDPYQATGI